MQPAVRGVCSPRRLEVPANQLLDLTGAAACFSAELRRCSGPGRSALSFGHGGTPMSTPEPSGASPARKAGVPRRLAFVLAPLLFLVAHGVLPWAISLLGPWYGWTDDSQPEQAHDTDGDRNQAEEVPDRRAAVRPPIPRAQQRDRPRQHPMGDQEEEWSQYKGQTPRNPGLPRRTCAGGFGRAHWCTPVAERKS